MFLAGCGAGGQGSREERVVASRSIEQVLEEHNRALMAIRGVVGTAIGLCDGTPCITVMLADSSALKEGKIPAQLEGYRVRADVTGPIQAR